MRGDVAPEKMADGCLRVREDIAGVGRWESARAIAASSAVVVLEVGMVAVAVL